MRQKSAVRNLQKKLSLLKAGSRISPDFTVDVKSPISGIILKKNINQGAFIKSGMLAYQIADMSQMWVKVQVCQNALNFIKVGMPATIMIEGLQAFSGKVDFITPFMDAKTKKVEVRVVVENPAGKITPNMFAKVALKSPAKTLLTLPKSAVLSKGAKHFVFKPVDENEFQPVEVVAKRLDSYAITNGLYDADDDEDW